MSAPGKIDEGITNFKEKVIPAAKQGAGFVGATLLVNRETGEVTGSTLWASVEAMNKAEQAGKEARRQSGDATGAVVLDVDRFELTVFERSAGTELPTFTRLTSGYGDIGRSDEIAKFTREQILPVLKAQPGFRAFVAGTNRATGRGFTSSSWASAAEREASQTVIASLRDQLTENGGLYGMKVDLFETVVAELLQPATV